MQKQKIKYLLTVCVGGLIGLLSFVRVSYAETLVKDSNISQDTVWTKSGSPYIVDSPLTVSAGTTLDIDAGVTIIASSTIDIEGGRLRMNGSADDHIIITGSGNAYVTMGGLIKANYADISLAHGFGADNGNITISSSTLSGAETGLLGRSGVISISNSRIFGNRYGLYILPYNSFGAFQVADTNSEYGVGGIGNALLSMVTISPHSVTVTGSSFTDNSEASIDNEDPYTYVQAIGNWWGTVTGPVATGNNKVSGLITSDPWLTQDPFATVATVCCSNILFIPGLEGTQLFKQEKVLGVNTTNQLWEPNRNLDVRKLYLDSAGSSTDKTIYSGGPIGKALGLEDVYGGFMDFLDSIQKSGKINAWKAFGYDWRKPIAEVVAGSEKKSMASESLIQTASELASSSRTRKVTIIAHSNGGLVAKYLIKTLSDMGKSGIIDSVISVAVPYLGTPEAIAGLLHGDDQAILNGWILNAATARGLGVNMSSAYSLLPSKEYFSEVFSPTIVFASTTVTGVNKNIYPQSISDLATQSSFIGDSHHDRRSASADDLSLPVVGNQKLLASASAIHDVLDLFSWPTNIARWALVGWNAVTTKSIVYSNEKKCDKNGTNCTVAVSHIATTTNRGDGTVVVPSAAYDAGTEVALDLGNISKQENHAVTHVNILDATSTEKAIEKIVSHNPADDQKKIIGEISKIQGVSIGLPDSAKMSSNLVLRTHSPVELNVYDSEGRHTGIIPKPASLIDVEDGLYTFTESNILGSSIKIRQGDSVDDNDYEIYLPDRDGEKYTVVMNGTGMGEFSYDASRVNEGTILDKVEFDGMPVTPLTIATTTIIAADNNGIVAQALYSASSTMTIDLDGNGSTDIIATSSTVVDASRYLRSVCTFANNLTNNSKRSRDLCGRVDKMLSPTKQDKGQWQHRQPFYFADRIAHIRFKKITDDDKSKVMDMMDKYVSQYE